MIEKFYLDEWRQHAPWIYTYQIEQDLVISRALVNLYERPKVRESLIFRGGTALNKIYFKPAMRYSEDIDFVQIKSEPIGPIIDEIRMALQPWLGEPKRKMTERSVKLIYQYASQENRVSKLKIEINTTEHFHVLPLVPFEFFVNSRWFSGKTNLTTCHINELMATKLRALYQRRKGRDLFDAWVAIKNNLIDCNVVIDVFNVYCENNEKIITRAMFEKNLYEKCFQKDFQVDVNELITQDNFWSFNEAYEIVTDKLISLLPGKTWKVN